MAEKKNAPRTNAAGIRKFARRATVFLGNETAEETTLWVAVRAAVNHRQKNPCGLPIRIHSGL